MLSGSFNATVGNKDPIGTTLNSNETTDISIDSKLTCDVLEDVNVFYI